MNLPFLMLLLGVAQGEYQEWNNFKVTYQKSYDSLKEEAYRRAIFLKNYRGLQVHNQKYDDGLETFKKGINEFSDMEPVEFREKMLGDIKNAEAPEPNIGELDILEQEAVKLELEQKWNEFKMTHTKQYNSLTEEIMRKEIFDNNVKKIKEHNERFHQGLETFSMGINQFTDLTSQEFKDIYLTYRPLNGTIYDTVEESFREISDEDQAPLTARSYWYTKQIPIKNQAACGSCWAFSVTGVLEYAYYLFHNKKIVSLSEQELVDCDHKSRGCNGGIPYYTFQWVEQNGINFENEYPYEKRQGSCRRKHNNASPKIIKSVGFTGTNEKAMLQKLQSNGPIQVAVCADHWQHYSGGYFVPNNCNGRMSNHAVIAIGAVNDKGKNVWILRNSWGASWGISGHAKVVMFQNTCNIAQQSASFINH